MGQKFLIRLTAFATAMAVMILGAGVAWADTIDGDADSDAIASPHANSLSANQAAGTTVDYPLSALIKETSNANDDVFARAGDTVAVTVTRSGDWLATSPNSGTNFAAAFTAYDVAQSASIRITVPACTAASTSKTMQVDLSGVASNERTIAGKSFTYTITATAGTSTCSSGDTVAPADASISINDGATWTNSATGAVTVDISASDAVGITSYRLATSELGLGSASPSAVSPAETAFARSDLAYTLAGPEGTNSVWLRVCDAANNCSTASDSIGWDKTAPNAPTASANRAADYDGGTPSDPSDDWWKNTVTVSFTANGDPGGAAASGVNVSTLSTSETFNTTGTHTTMGGTLQDNAGNTSARGGLTVKVDATEPTVTLTGGCPTAPPILGSTAGSVTWAASDGTTGSGLATAASGSLSLDTSSVGAKRVTAPQATDNVGLTSNQPFCDYSVIYDWTGFFRPIDNGGVYNKAKAGSAIPVKFSLGGDQGLDIFATGTKMVSGAEVEFTYPSSSSITCNSSAEVDAIEETVTAGSSSLSYDPVTGEYNYVWKTEKGWAGTCRQLVVKLDDGTVHRANFTFTK